MIDPNGFDDAVLMRQAVERVRASDVATSWGLDARLISPVEARELVPLLNADQIHGAYHVPSDGIAKAVLAADALARRAQQIYVAEVPVLALRVSYVGELGWELYAPSEYRARLWDVLWTAGRPHEMIAAGRGAFDALRLEKGYRLWGNDMHTDFNPYEAGLDWTVDLDKPDFIGRDALLRLRERGVDRRLCCLVLDDPTVVVMGKEPVRDSDRVLGYVTSANFGYSVGKSIAYAYLPVGYAEPGTVVAIEYFGRRYQATVSSDPLFDPQMQRLRSYSRSDNVLD